MRQNRAIVLGAGLAVQCWQEEEWGVVTGLGTRAEGNTHMCWGNRRLLHRDVVPQPHFCRLTGSPEGSLWKRRSLWILCGRKAKYGIFERNWKEKGKLICCYVRSHKAPLEEFLKKRLCLLWRGSLQFYCQVSFFNLLSFCFQTPEIAQWFTESATGLFW